MKATRSALPALAWLLVAVAAACGTPPMPTPPGSAGPSMTVLLSPSPAAAAPSPAPTVSPAPPTAVPSRRSFAPGEMVVGFAQSQYVSGWFAANRASLVEEALRRGVVLRRTVAADNDFATQIAQLRTMMADASLKVIVLDPVQESGYEPVLREARAAGKLVIVERRRLAADPALYLTFVGSDFSAEGQAAGEALCRAFGAGFGRRIVALVVADAAAPDYAGPERASGVGRGVADCGSLVDTVTDLTRGGDVEAMTSGYFATHAPEMVDGIVVTNGSGTTGVARAIEAAGARGKILVIGFGGDADAIRALAGGDAYAIAYQEPLLAPLIYDAALDGLNGKPVPASIAPKDEVYTIKTVPDCWIHGCPRY